MTLRDSLCTSRARAVRLSAGRIVACIPLLLVPSRAAFPQATPQWSVEAPTGPAQKRSFTVSEGTLMNLTVSPDGQFIAFDLLGAIYEIPISGGTARRLTSGLSWNLAPKYSPDGTRIAFASDRAGSYDIWSMDRQGASLERLSHARVALSENFARPAWSADGRLVYATASSDGAPNQLVTLDRFGSHQVVLQGGDVLGGVAVEGDGAGLYLERSNGPLYAFSFNPYVTPASGIRIDRIDQRNGEVTTTIARPGGALAPALSPNGKSLAFVHRAIDETILIVRDVITGRERTILRGLDRDRQQSAAPIGSFPNLAWTPDGSRLLVATGGHINAVDVTTGATSVIPFTATVEREYSETLRFRTSEPVDRATTRMHRWGARTPQGILYEALGDLWLTDGKSTPRNITRSSALETSPVFDSKSGTLYYAAWTDDSLGAIYKSSLTGAGAAAPTRLTSVPAQYGSLAVTPDGARIAYVRGAAGLGGGLWLSNETQFDLMVREANGPERRVTGITGHALEYANTAGKIPPTVMFAPNGNQLYFTEFEGEDLVLKRIALDGNAETVLYRFPNAVTVVPSPDLRWMAVREYQRSYLVPWTYTGQPITLSPYDGSGGAVRVDAEDGGYLTWSSDGRTLAWTRAGGFYEKSVEKILADARAPRAVAPNESWTGDRVPGSTATRTALGISFDIDRPQGVVALTHARVITMNARRDVMENATVVLEDGKIAALGTNVSIPSGAKVYDVAGETIIPGLIDAHAHPHIEHSTLHVIEQQPSYFSAPLAYGVTTMVEVYGNEYRDAWLSDMLRAGKIAGPRYFTTGSPIFGERRGMRRLMFRPIETLDDAREQLRWNKDFGAIAVKDYVQFVRKRRSLTIAAARELGLNVVSESAADPEMNFTQIMDGVTGIEHSMSLFPFYDDVVKFWGETKAGMTPTLIVGYNVVMGEGFYHQAGKLWEDPKLTKFITPEQLMRVRSPTKLWDADMAVLKLGNEVHKLYRNGTSLQMGAHGQMFGVDAHWEMDLLAKSGFSPMEVLELSTIRGAAQHGLDAQLGSLEVGKLADLVVLDANPLDDITNALKIRYVLKNGVVYAGADAARVWPDPKPAPKPYFVGR